MPTYEMPILLRIMSKSETATVLKRVSNIIFDKGGFIRKIENLGQHPLPHKISVHNMQHRTSSNFIFYFDAPPRNVESLKDEYKRDLDVIKSKVFKSFDEDAPKRPCTWHKEMLPVPFRKDVQKLIKMSKQTAEKSKEKSFKFNTGLDYYPFQR